MGYLLKLRQRSLLTFVILTIVYVVACNKADHLEAKKPVTFKEGEKAAGIIIPIASNDLKLRMEQRAILTTLAFKDPDILSEYVAAVKSKLQFDPLNNDEAITFDEIATEQPAYVASFAQKFKRAYRTFLESHSYYRHSQFSALALGEPSGRIDSTSMPEYIDVFYRNDGAQLYFPYSENYSILQVTQPNVTYHPVVSEPETTEGFKLVSALSDNLQPYAVIEQRAVNDEPTIIVNFNEEPISGVGGIDSTPPPPQYQCNFLNYNTYSDVLDDRYVISASIPKIKISDNFRTFVGGTNRLTLVQCYTKPDGINANPSTTLPVLKGDHRYVFKDKKIKRKYVGQWIDIGDSYNDDWKLIQYENPAYFFKKLGWFTDVHGKIDVDISAGVKMEVTQDSSGQNRYRWVPNFSADAKANVSASIGTFYDLIGSDNITRRGLLANCVGDNLGNGTLDMGGIPWTIRNVASTVQYAFRLRECH